MNPPSPSVISKIYARGELRDILFQRSAKRPCGNANLTKGIGAHAYAFGNTTLQQRRTNYKLKIVFLVVYIVFIFCSKRSSYEVNITENSPSGTSVLQVTVTQHRPGAILTYKIVPSNSEFQINKSTVSAG